MKLRKIWIAAGAMFTIATYSACNKDFLNTTPLSEISSSVAWTDGALAQAFVTDIYNGFEFGGFHEQMIASLTDEAVFTHSGRGINVVNEGSASSTNPGWQSGEFEWGRMYRFIRASNLALENLAISTFDDQNLKDRLKGEAYFLRAFFYNQLVSYYGAVPIVERSYGLNDDYSIARNTYKECVDFIVKNADSAVILLTGKSMDKGRANALAAKALKARILTHAASDLHDAATAKSKSTVLSGYANPEFFAYTDGDRTSRWQLAKAAAKEVLDAGGGYKLDLTAPASPEDAKLNYMSIAMGGESAYPGMDAAAASEILLGRYFTPEKDEWYGIRVGIFNGPNGYHNWAGNTPVGTMVDDYEMADGSKFSWSNSSQASNPYKNREPRFYATILYDGADWKPRNLVSGNVDPANQIQTGKYDLVLNGSKVIFSGLDTRSSTIEDWNGSRTGYYFRKFTDPDPAIVEASGFQTIPWPFFRYTEAVFNYAEACIQLGELAEATTWLNKIRFRAGMPAITETGKEALMTRLIHEKRIEMAFEEQRYHDARRWMIAPTTLGRKLSFINITGTFKSGKSLSDVYRHDESIYDYKYTPIIDQSHENRTWVDKMYFYPIHRDELNKNNLLVQNPGYE